MKKKRGKVQLLSREKVFHGLEFVFRGFAFFSNRGELFTSDEKNSKFLPLNATTLFPLNHPIERDFRTRDSIQVLERKNV